MSILLGKMGNNFSVGKKANGREILIVPRVLKKGTLVEELDDKTAGELFLLPFVVLVPGVALEQLLPFSDFCRTLVGTWTGTNWPPNWS